MHDKRYIFGFFFFFVFLTIMLIYIWPSGPGNARIGSYFTKPVGNIHYSQVLNGTNMTACISIENTPFNAFDLVNYSFQAKIWVDVLGYADVLIAEKDWNSNFTLYRNEVVTIKISFIASYNYTIHTGRGIYIEAGWGEPTITEVVRMAEMQVGATEEVVSPFDLSSSMILISAIGLGGMLFIIAITARQDFQSYLKRKKVSQRPTPTEAPTPPSTAPEEPSVHPPISPVLPSVAPPAPEQRHVETMILIPCPRCGSKLDKSQVVCATCGHEFQKCVVCNLIIEDDEQTQSCPECGALGHRDHFREWVHVNGKCPICKKPLSF